MNNQLNLPTFEMKTRTDGDKVQVFDLLRQRFVALTPEENVRQHFINYLINYKGFPKTLIANEVEISLNGMSRRCDSVVYNKELSPLVIVEYKRPDVEITQNVFNQICRYNMVMKVDYLIVSNGLYHYCCKMNYAKNSVEFLQDIPLWENLIS